MTLGPTSRDGVERLVEQVLFGPLDLSIRVIEEVPDVIARTRRDLTLARFLGKLVVDQGLVEVRRRLDLGVPLDGGSPAREAGRARSDAAAGDGPDVEGAELDADEPAQPAPAASELALPDYDQLPAAHIVAKLAGLTPAERDAIERFESQHRHRRTILGKLAQLREP